MPQKLITVVGATGAQGSAIIDALLKNPEYKLRGITRTPDSATALALKSKGVEVVQADLNNQASLHAAFAGSYAVYAMTDMPGMALGGLDIKAAAEAEKEQGINIAQACLKTTGLERFIWSTLPDVATLSGGAFDPANFRGKVAVDTFIRAHPELLAKTTFFFISQYHSNYKYPPLSPHLIATAGDGKEDVYVQFASHPLDTPITTIGDVRRNLGPFITAIMAQPEKTRGGAYVLAHVEVVSAEESLQAWARAQGVRAISVPISTEKFSLLFGKWDFLGSMWRSWAALGDRAWSLVGGEKVLTKDDLGVTGLTSLADSYKLAPF